MFLLLRPPTSYDPDNAILTMSCEVRKKLETMGYSSSDKLDKFELDGKFTAEGENWVLKVKAKTKGSKIGQLRYVFGREPFLLTHVMHLANDLRKYGLEVIEP